MATRFVGAPGVPVCDAHETRVSRYLAVAPLLLGLLLGPSFCQSFAATYYVATNGNDTLPGSQAQPWRTISKATAVLVAGDTVLIGPGDYNEDVHETTSGAVGRPIVYRANPAWGASLRAFRMDGSYLVLDGLKFTKYSGVGNSWSAATRVEASAYSSIITNCFYSDVPFVVANDFRFEANGNKVISDSSNFQAAGFQAGSKVYLGACGLPGMWYTNHDNAWIVASNTATTMWLTSPTGKTFAPDAGSNYWAVVRAADFNIGFQAVETILSGGVGPTNLLITGNFVSNWVGTPLIVNTDNVTVENNTFTRLHGFRFLDFGSANLMVRSNVVKDSPNMLYFTQAEGALLIHDSVASWFDHQLAMFSDTSLRPLQTNVVFAYNWLEGIDNQLGGVGDTGPDCYGITFHNNVFVGISDHFSGGRDGMRWISNTFYKCTFDGASPLQTGSSPPQQGGYVFTGNLFIDCGKYQGLDGNGYYSITSNATNPIVNSNMVAGPEISGYIAKQFFNEANGVNGGNPVFLSVMTPMGPDGLPFTPDDGLKVLPNSPAARLGGGACGVFQPQAGHPVAHFRITSPKGWFEPTGDAEWLAKRPGNRNRAQRPYTTLSLLGTAPVTAVFDASESLPGTGDTITEYTWTFDSVSVTTNTPTIAHAFTSAGTKIVQLTVKNGTGNTHTFANVYRVAGPGGTKPSAPQRLRVTQ